MERRTDTLTRAIYATDAGNYRIPPQAVAFPRTRAELRDGVLRALAVGEAVTMRGGGTSCAGNSIGPGLVIDTSRYYNQVLEINPAEHWARVQPGLVMADLQTAAAPHGLRFGPDPSSWTRATVGGLIGNNACGPHAQAWGRTGDNVLTVDVVDGAGRTYTAGRGEDALAAVPGLRELVLGNLALIRTEFGRFSRQVSGYAMEQLLPENGYNLAGFLVGSEGTLAVIEEAQLNLVEIPSAPVLVGLGYPDMIAAAYDVPTVNAFKPLAVEGMDARLVDVVRRVKGPGAVPELPAGGGWLLVEVDGPNLEAALERAHEIVAAAHTDAAVVYPPGSDAAALWRIRADGAGLGGRTPVVEHADGSVSGGEQAWPGWEDAAVPPEALGDYLRDFTAVMRRHEVDGLLYGHLGDGCLHVRLDLPLGSAATTPRARAFLEDAAALVGRYGGSISGEHGDGRARSELLHHMYSREALNLFAQVKALFDPQWLLNPGVLVKPDLLDANLRRPAARRLGEAPGGFTFPRDHADFTTAVHRCTGVGKCRAGARIVDNRMCPSYRATHEEKDATRGRARALEEVTNGSLIANFGDPALLEALDLCLACKACSRDCPAGIDMATYRSEAFYRAYWDKGRSGELSGRAGKRAGKRAGNPAGRAPGNAAGNPPRKRPRPPRSHYLLGRLPWWLKLARRVPFGARLGNFAFAIPPVKWLVFKAFGLDNRRKMARFSPQSFTQWARAHGSTRLLPAATRHPGEHRPENLVAVWADSFSEGVDPAGAEATVELLEKMGYRVVTPLGACCGLTWITTGQLDGARARQRDLLTKLAPLAANGIPIVGVEPSCTAVLREDLPRLLPDDPRAGMVAGAAVTLAEFLRDHPAAPDSTWHLPDLTGVKIVAQPHCHHYAVLGWDADRELLRAAGAEVQEIKGCCGMAGNFGMERGHYEVSVKVAELELLPALSEARAEGGAVILADGFSCRTQIGQLAGRQGIHLAQLLLGKRG